MWVSPYQSLVGLPCSEQRRPSQDTVTCHRGRQAHFNTGFKSRGTKSQLVQRGSCVLEGPLTQGCALLLSK